MKLGDVLISLGIEDPSSAEYLADPSFRVVASFFLGGLFFFSVQQLVLSPLLRSSFHRLRKLILVRRLRRRSVQAPSFDSEKQLSPSDDGFSTISGTRIERNNLTFTLTVCFALAALAQMIALTTFRSSHSDAACAFVVAWGGMAHQSGRIIALLKLSLDLMSLGAKRWESFTFWGWLIVSLVFMFITNAVSIGTLRPFPVDELQEFSLCYRKHFFPTAILLSLLNLVLEVYVIGRLFSLSAPAFLSRKDRLRALGDIRSLRASSLLILDLLTIVPSAVFFNILSEYLPFAVGAILVVAAFNYSPRSSQPQPVPVSVPPSIRTLSLGSLVMPPTHARSHSDGHPPAVPTKDLPTPRLPHPFASDALVDPTPEADYPAPMTARTSVVSPDSDSINGAVVKLAFREPVRGKRRSSNYSVLSPTTANNDFRMSAPAPRNLRIPSSIIEFATHPETSAASTAPTTAIGQAPQLRLIVPELPPAVPAKGSPASARTVADPQSSRHSYHRSQESTDTVPPTPGSSVLYGSDVVRNPNRPAMERLSASSAATTGHGTASTEPESTESRPNRVSVGSSRFPPAKDDLSVVYEASFEASDSISNSNSRARQTFGEAAFRGAPLPPRSTSSVHGSDGHSPPSTTRAHATPSPPPRPT